MRIFIKDKKLGNENYQYNVWINEKKTDKITSNKNMIQVECPTNSTVKIRVENILFEAKQSYLLFLLYWFLSCISGSGEQDPFGKPFNARIDIADTGENDIFLEVNSIWCKEAFLVQGNCDVSENSLFSPLGYKKKWFWGFAMPVSILILLILFMFIVVDVMGNRIVFKALFLAVPTIIELLWIAYVVKVLRR